MDATQPKTRRKIRRAFRPESPPARMQTLAALGLLLSLGAAGAGCDATGTVGGPNPQQNPIITRFEVFPNAQNPGRGPFELLAQASGEGLLTFSWSATGGVLSVASESATASGPVLVPSLSAWDPPAAWGHYEVSVIVTDSGGGSFRRIARFEVTPETTRILAPRPSRISPPAVWPY